MNDPTTALTIQFLTWIAASPRSYAETMEAWRTSCPRLSIWEDAVREGLVRLERSAGGMKTRMVALTPAGQRLLDAARATPPTPAAVMLEAVG